MASPLDAFASRLAVYSCNYVILFLFPPSGLFHLALWEDGLVMLLPHSGGKLLCQTHLRLSGDSAPSSALSDYFFSALLAHPSPTRAAEGRLTAADDFRDAHEQMRNSHYEKIFSPAH